MKFPMMLAVLLTSAFANTRAYQASVASAQSEDEIKDTLANATSQEAAQTVITISGAASDPIVLKGASAGRVTLIAPSRGPIVIARGIDSNTKEEHARTDGAGAVVALDNVGGAGLISISEGTDGLEGSGGLVSSSAVIGPSTGAVIVAGPTAPPLILAAPELSTESAESIDSTEMIPEASVDSSSTEGAIRVYSSLVGSINMSVGAARPSSRDDSFLIDEGTELDVEVSENAKVEDSQTSTSRSTALGR